jgi:hypothetical protein
MADASAIITSLGQQLAQLTVDKAILEVEVAELRARLEAADGCVAPLGGVDAAMPDAAPSPPREMLDT